MPLLTLSSPPPETTTRTRSSSSSQQQHQHQHHHPLLTAAAAVGVWLAFPCVIVSTKCLLSTAADTTCLRVRTFAIAGADYAHPLSAAALHLLLVGTALALGHALWNSLLVKRLYCCYCIATTTSSSVTTTSCAPPAPNTGDFSSEPADEQPPPVQSLKSLLRSCAATGAAFGAKYVVGHGALLVTPSAAVYELFHCLNLVFIALLARLVLGERLRSNYEVVACLGIVVGSAMVTPRGLLFAKHDDHDDHQGAGPQGVVGSFVFLAPLALNLLNAALAGAVVVLLRWTMLQCPGQVTQVTACKMLIGAAVLLPFAAAVEGSALFALNRQQWLWLFISSAAILVYHLNLSLLCWLASAPTVGVVESLRPIPAFALIGLLQTFPTKSAWFWAGSAVILGSAVMFQLSRQYYGCGTMIAHEESSRSIDISLLAKTEKGDPRRDSNTTEITHLLEDDC